MIRNAFRINSRNLCTKELFKRKERIKLRYSNSFFIEKLLSNFFLISLNSY